MPAELNIRAERAGDAAALRLVNLAAFPTPAEADLVDALRAAGVTLISQVALRGDEFAGHILFSPVTLADEALPLMGLAPMAVMPSLQRQGVGSTLVRAGLEACRDAGIGAVVVLGHPGYYPRFGFVPAATRGIDSAYDVPPEAFMVLELRPDFLRHRRGRIRYHPAFASL